MPTARGWDTNRFSGVTPWYWPVQENKQTGHFGTRPLGTPFAATATQVARIFVAAFRALPSIISSLSFCCRKNVQVPPPSSRHPSPPRDDRRSKARDQSHQATPRNNWTGPPLGPSPRPSPPSTPPAMVNPSQLGSTPSGSPPSASPRTPTDGAIPSSA